MGEARGTKGAVSRGGFILNLTLCAIALVIFFAFGYFLIVRQQTALGSKLLADEIAYQLALGGVNAGLGYVLDPNANSRIWGMLKTATVGQLQGQKELVPRDYPPIQKLVNQLKLDAKLEVELMLTDVREFPPPDLDSGILRDPNEKFGGLRITATARFQGAARRVILYKEFKVVYAMPQVVGKFTLFASTRLPGQALNKVRIRKVDLRTGQILDNQLSPLFLKNGAGRNPEENGWVFLGGPANGGVNSLNLAWGENNYGEQAVLLRKAWQVNADPQIARPLPADFESLLLQRGFFTGIKADTDTFTHYPFDQPVEDPVGEDAALLHLYGAPPDAGLPDADMEVSPTYVLGPVVRRFLQLRYVRKKSNNAVDYCPYSGPEDWEPPGPPDKPWTKPAAARPFDTKSVVFGQNYSQYSAYMSHVVKESYNRGVDFLRDQTELSPAYQLVETTRVKHRQFLNEFLYDPRINTGFVIIQAQGGQKIFDGYLNRIAADDMRVPDRALESYPASRFPAWLAKNPTKLTGIVRFYGADTGITIDRPLQLTSGGILAADGPITIEAPISCPSGIPLTLMSLRGDITLKTGTVEASLVALAGTVKRHASFNGPLKIHGQIVANNLDYVQLCQSSTISKITYDTRLDPTAGPDALQQAYAVGLTHWRTLYSPPVD